MKTIALIAFEQFTDIDLFLMWDILGRQRQHWQVRILGSQPELRSANGGAAAPRSAGRSQSCRCRTVRQRQARRAGGAGRCRLPRQLPHGPATPADRLHLRRLLLPRRARPAPAQPGHHPSRRPRRPGAMGVTSDERPFVCDGNVATAGGCLSALYGRMDRRAAAGQRPASRGPAGIAAGGAGSPVRAAGRGEHGGGRSVRQGMPGAFTLPSLHGAGVVSNPIHCRDSCRVTPSAMVALIAGRSAAAGPYRLCAIRGRHPLRIPSGQLRPGHRRAGVRGLPARALHIAHRHQRDVDAPGQQIGRLPPGSCTRERWRHPSGTCR